MGKPELTAAESSAVNALLEVIGDDPQEARRIIAALSFRDRALLTAWADELKRLALDGQTDYENRERRTWRDIRDASFSTA